MVAGLAAAAVFAGAPAAGAKTIDVDQWTEGFCVAIEDWQTSASKAHDLVQGVVDDGVTSSAKAKAVRAKIVKALDTASRAAGTASKDIKALGDPDVPDGAQVRATLVSTIGGSGAVFAAAKDDVADAPVDPKRFRSALSRISDHVDQELDEAGQRIESIESLADGGDLDTAIETEEACDFINGT
jgi:hypothetical protein